MQQASYPATKEGREFFQTLVMTALQQDLHDASVASFFTQEWIVVSCDTTAAWCCRKLFGQLFFICRSWTSTCRVACPSNCRDKRRCERLKGLQLIEHRHLFVNNIARFAFASFKQFGLVDLQAYLVGAFGTRPYWYQAVKGVASTLLYVNYL